MHMGQCKMRKKLDFLKGLHSVVEHSQLPKMVGGDFNFIGKLQDKFSGNVNNNLMEAFNDFVAETELKELHRAGGQFTWANKRVNPVMFMLDRVFVSTEWENQFPMVTAQSRVGSDHILCWWRLRWRGE